ncbi:MAG: tetratricopeptide repeat protein [Planctomycetota bacterium]
MATEQPRSRQPVITVVCVPGLARCLPADQWRPSPAQPDIAVLPMRCEGPGLALQGAVTVATGVPAWRHRCLDSGIFDATLGSWREPARRDIAAQPGWEVLERLGVRTEVVGWFGDQSIDADRLSAGRQPSADPIVLGDRVVNALRQNDDLARRRAALEAVEGCAGLESVLELVASRVEGGAADGAAWSVWACATGFGALARNGLVEIAALRGHVLGAFARLADRIGASPSRPLLIVGTPAVATQKSRHDSGPTHSPRVGTLIVLGAGELVQADREIRDSDVWPSVLAWLGLPAAADLPGMPFLPRPTDQAPAETVFTHETPGLVSALGAENASDHPEAASIAWLRTQGYAAAGGTLQPGTAERAAASRAAHHEACSLLNSGLADRAVASIRSIDAASQLPEHDELLALAAFECDDRAALAEALDRLKTRGIRSELTELAEVFLQPVDAAERLGRLHDAVESSDRKTTLTDGAFRELIARVAERSAVMPLAEAIYGRIARSAESAGDSAVGWCGLARLALAQDEPKRASAHAAEAIQRSRTPSTGIEALAVAARAAQALGETNEAITHLRALVGLRPDHGAAVASLVELLRSVGEHEEAMRLEFGHATDQ